MTMSRFFKIDIAARNSKVKTSIMTITISIILLFIFALFQVIMKDETYGQTGWISDDNHQIKKACIDKAEEIEKDDGGNCDLEWKQFGPTGGGRMEEIVVDPSNSNIAYVGSDVNYLFKTTNGGETWEQLHKEGDVFSDDSMGWSILGVSREYPEGHFPYF